MREIVVFVCVLGFINWMINVADYGIICDKSAPGVEATKSKERGHIGCRLVYKERRMVGGIRVEPPKKQHPGQTKMMKIRNE